jgi:hypothetical protein
LKRNRSTNITTSYEQEQLIMTVSILFWFCLSIGSYIILIIFYFCAKRYTTVGTRQGRCCTTEKFHLPNRLVKSCIRLATIKWWSNLLGRHHTLQRIPTAHWVVASVRKHHTSLNLFNAKYSIHTLSITDKI